MSQTAHRRDWEELANVDPMWAVLSDPAKKNSWNESEFFAEGESEIAAVMQNLSRLGYPKSYRRALDFGCGVGRLSRALSTRFDEVWGVDISQQMIEKARRYVPTGHFLVNESTTLPFESGTFDFIYTALVLQHMPSKGIIAAYIREFLRIINRDGIAVFHFLSHVPLINRIQPRRRAYSLLRHLGLSPKRLLGLNLDPMKGTAIPERQVLRIVSEANCRVAFSDTTNRTVVADSRTFYVVKA